MFMSLDMKFRLSNHIRDDVTYYQWECTRDKYKQYTQQYKRNETALGLHISSFCHQGPLFLTWFNFDPSMDK